MDIVRSKSNKKQTVTKAILLLVCLAFSVVVVFFFINVKVFQ